MSEREIGSELLVVDACKAVNDIFRTARDDKNSDTLKVLDHYNEQHKIAITLEELEALTSSDEVSSFSVLTAMKFEKLKLIQDHADRILDFASRAITLRGINSPAENARVLDLLKYIRTQIDAYFRIKSIVAE